MGRMFRLLKECEIECKVKQVKQNGLVLLLYKTARTDMDLLDETVGPYRWECEYKEIKGNLFCGIGILKAPEKDDDWDRYIWKWDCGIESRSDGEGNEKKGEASDSFKRAGFKWGIGRELYTAPFIWIPSDKANITEKNGKFYCNDKFSVEKIAYNEDGDISGLAIRNDKTGKRCFVWQRT